MILLVTDTSGRNGTVALARVDANNLKEADILEVVPLAGGMFSAQLVPQIAALLQNHGLNKTDIDAFVVVSGPGSFTGLRVGLAAIKALSEILHKPVAPVSLLELVAADSGAQGNIAVALDGGRREVFFGSYKVAGESIQILREELLSQADFVAAARDSTVLTPDAALATIARDAGLTVLTAQHPNPEMIARFGWKKLQAGATVSPEKLEANYMRRSDAEMFVKQSS